MAETHHKKQQITALTALRIQVQDEALLLSRKLDLKQHFLKSIIRGNGPAVPPYFGWLLSRFLPVKRGYILTASVKSRSNLVTRGRLASFGEKCGNSQDR
jgi:hypothetical protein